MKKDFEALNQLFGSYLHQDWVEEFDTDVAAIQAMIDGEPKEALVAASKEIRELLSSNLPDAELAALMTDEVGCFFEPASKGESYRTWLGSALVQLEANVRH